MDVTQALKDTENSLRDFIAVCLESKFKDEWISKCGVTEQRIEAWKGRKITEERRQEAGAVEERLLYYADFYDLKTILKKHWGEVFTHAFGDWKTMEVWLTEMEKLRDPDAHRRELLPHQKHLILGISGEIRTRLIKYRSKMETGEDYFPRIDTVRDSLGNIHTANSITKRSKHSLRPGDVLDFIITASDPFGEDLLYAISLPGNHQNLDWQHENTFQLVIQTEQIGSSFGVMLWIKSFREYHANDFYDDCVTFVYEVLPLKK